MDTNRESIIAKIKKLLAMANDGRGNVQEAETAARQAEALMRKYHLDMAEVEVNELKSEKPEAEFITGARPGKENAKQNPKWVNLIAWGVAQLYDCRVTQVHRPEGPSFCFIGFGPDVKVAAWTTQALKDAVYTESRRVTEGVSNAASFRMGAASALQHRLVALRAERDAEYKQAPSGGTALAVINTKLARLEEIFGQSKDRTVKSSVKRDGAYDQGRQFGNTMNLPNRPLPSQPERKALN